MSSRDRAFLRWYAWAIGLFCLIAVWSVQPQTVQAELPTNVQQAAVMVFDAERNGLRTTTGNVAASPALVVASYAASAPAGIVAASSNMAVNLAQTGGTTVVTNASGAVPVWGVSAHTLANAALTSLTDYVGSVNAICRISNGTTVDICRSSQALGSSSGTLTGVQAIAVYGRNTGGSAYNLNLTEAPGDGTAATNVWWSWSWGAVFNGTTWDRARSIITGTNSTGTGIAAVGLVAQLDDTAPSTVSENQFGNVRMSASRAVHVAGSYAYSNIATSASSQLKVGPGLLHTLTINTRGTGSTVVLWDSSNCVTGSKIATVDTTLSTTAFIYDVAVTAGLCVNATGAGAADLTVTYN